MKWSVAGKVLAATFNAKLIVVERLLHGQEIFENTY